MNAAMTATREGAIARAEGCFDDGAYLAALRRLVAVPTESQMKDSQPALTRYCAETMPALINGMGFSTTVLDNPRPGRGPVFVATRIEDPALPTVLVYGHGDVVRGLAGKWTGGLDPWAVSVRDDKWYGRGTVDNKGQHLIAIEALRYGRGSLLCTTWISPDSDAEGSKLDAKRGSRLDAI